MSELRSHQVVHESPLPHRLWNEGSIPADYQRAAPTVTWISRRLDKWSTWHSLGDKWNSWSCSCAGQNQAGDFDFRVSWADSNRIRRAGPSDTPEEDSNGRPSTVRSPWVNHRSTGCDATSAIRTPIMRRFRSRRNSKHY